MNNQRKIMKRKTEEKLLHYVEKCQTSLVETGRLFDKYLILVSMVAVALLCFFEIMNKEDQIVKWGIALSSVFFSIAGVITICSYYFSNKYTKKVLDTLRENWNEEPMEALEELKDAKERKQLIACEYLSIRFFIMAVIIFSLSQIYSLWS